MIQNMTHLLKKQERKKDASQGAFFSSCFEYFYFDTKY